MPFHRVQMWNGRFFEPSDLLMHTLSLDLHHYLDDCLIPTSTEAQMMSDLDISDEGGELLDKSEPQEASEWTTNFGSRSNLIIVSSTGIFKRAV
jgi:hypothetical protein